VDYRVTKYTTELTVRSAGPDGMMFNQDDIVVKKIRVRKDAAEKGARGFSRGFTRGVIDGLKKKKKE
jgi:hypothetical protein